MQGILWITVIVIVIIICFGIALYIQLPNKVTRNSKQISGVDDIAKENENGNESDHVFSITEADSVTVLEVVFEGYTNHFTYAVNQKNIKKNQHVLVLTQDGIRCAKVVTNPQNIKLSELTFPSFLLQSIICVADETDIEYYN
ncbi:MAG: hypothetical protein ACRCS6_04795 [Turicibacter sp.]